METIDDIFLNAREITDAEKRASYLTKACGNDTNLRQRVEAMLRDAEEAGKFFGGEKTVVVTPPVASAKPPLETVRYFGDYELLDEIARGGMGVVYQARQKSLNRIVAVKMILTGQFASEADVKRFRMEAESAANLQHPNIVAIHEIGDHDGRHYFSMDFVEGKNLAQVIGREAFNPTRAATLLKTIAEAVQYAHQRGILHRDLKPQNVLIDAAGQPRITDFGLAKRIEKDSDLTRTGSVMGSPSYMPPEQAMGKQGEISPASDVYSLGAILYQMLTGCPPFTGETPLEIMHQAVNSEPVPPAKLNPKVPHDLETICLKCLEKRPERRYHSARAVAEELERFLNFEPILAKPASRTRKIWSWTQQNPWVFAATCALMFLVMGCVAYGLWEKSRFLSSRLVENKESAMFQMEAAMPPMSARLQKPMALSAPEESPSMMFLVFFPVICILLYFADNSFRKAYRLRTETGKPLSETQLFIFGGTGGTAVIVGMGYLLLQIRAWVWLNSPGAMIGLEITAAVFALILNWMGFRMAWKSIGLHETSRFRGIVDKTFEEQMHTEKRRWPALKLMFFAPWVLLMLHGVLILIIMTFAGENAASKFIGLMGIVIVTGTALLIFRNTRKNLRILTTVYLPLLLALVVLFLSAFLTNTGSAFILAGATAYASFMILLGSLFTPRNTAPLSQRLFSRKLWLDVFYGGALWIVLLVGYYFLEGWHGKREWNRVKTDLLAKGNTLDWDALQKPRVPDSENVMTHPYMKKYFIKGESGKANPVLPIVHPTFIDPLDIPFSVTNLQKLSRHSESTVLPLVGLQASKEVIPLLSFTNEPLSSVFSALTARAGLAFRQGDTLSVWQGYGRSAKPRSVACTFTNVTALQALDQLAREQALVPDATEWREKHTLVFTNGSPSLQTLLEWSAHHADDFAQIEEAAQRPASRLYGDSRYPAAWPIPNFVSFRALSQICASRCKIHLLAGDTDSAMRDLRMLRRLMDMVQATDAPFLVEAMIRVAIGGLYTVTVQETLAARLWPEADLPTIQELGRGIDFLSEVDFSFRHGERTAILRVVQTGVEEGTLLGEFTSFTSGPNDSFGQKVIGSMIPTGWIDQNIANYARLIELAVTGWNQNGLVDARQIDENWSAVMKELETGPRFHYFLANIGIPNASKAFLRAAQIQTSVNQAYLACALERYHAATGEYPETLDRLVPEFAAQVPRDIMDGRPLRYRRVAPDDYLLYSIGWNEKDDAGQLGPVARKNSDWRDDLGDWVWQGVPKN